MSAMRDPKTKADVVDSLLRIDFSGDLRDLAVDRNIIIQRVKKNAVRLVWPKTGRAFDLTVHKRRDANPEAKAAKPKRAARPTTRKRAVAPANKNGAGAPEGDAGRKAA